MISMEYMSEEESEEQEGIMHFVVHSPSFRSSGMFGKNHLTDTYDAYK